MSHLLPNGHLPSPPSPSTHARRARRWSLLAAVTLLAPLAGVAGATVTASPAAAANSGGSQTFTSPGTEAFFTVPAAVTQLNIAAIGGSGGSGENDDTVGSKGGAGGLGGTVTASLAVTPGEVLTIFVGGAGQDASGGGAGHGGAGINSTGIFNQGGPGGPGDTLGRGGGGGGGSSQVFVLNGAAPLLVAGGGGGGGGGGGVGGGDQGGAGGKGGQPAGNGANGGGISGASQPGQGGAGGTGSQLEAGSSAAFLSDGGGGGGSGSGYNPGIGGSNGTVGGGGIGGQGASGDGGGGGAGGGYSYANPADLVAGTTAGFFTPLTRGDGSVTITWGAPQPVVTLTSDANPAEPGTITFSATVDPPAGVTSPAPTGNVTFYLNGLGAAASGTVALGNTGTPDLATLGFGPITSSLPDVIAVYEGDPVYGSVVSAALDQVVAATKAAQAIIFAPPSSGTAGGTVTLSANGGASGNPVVFTVDSSSGAGVCTTSGTNGTTLTYDAAGTCVIDANQAGNANYKAAPQVTRTITVGHAPTTLAAAPAITPGSAFPFVLRANLTSGGRPVAGQSVVFTAGTTLLCRSVTNPAGVATCNARTAAGVRAIAAKRGYTATYSGSPAHGPSQAQGPLVAVSTH